jgi:hypothetical protein
VIKLPRPSENLTQMLKTMPVGLVLDHKSTLQANMRRELVINVSRRLFHINFFYKEKPYINAFLTSS